MIPGRSVHDVIHGTVNEVTITDDEWSPRDIERDEIRERQAKSELDRLIKLGDMDSFRLLQLDLEEAEEAKQKAFQAKADEILASRQKEIAKINARVEAAQFDVTVPHSVLGELFTLQKGFTEPRSRPRVARSPNGFHGREVE